MTNNQKTNFKQAQKQYNRIKAEHERVKAIEGQSKIKVLTENAFYSEEDNNRITETNSDFLMSESDFTEYCKMVFAENIKAGLDIPDYDTTADYKTFKALKQSEENLLKAGFDIIPNNLKSEKVTLESVKNHWKYRSEMLDIMQRVAL
jgi:hypothetical protein